MSEVPYRKSIMETFGAKFISSPSNLTEIGRSILSRDPNTVCNNTPGT